jgi:hypothetical protein
VNWYGIIHALFNAAGAYAQDLQPLLYPQPAWSGVHTSSSSSRLRLGSTQQSSAGDNPLLAPNWKLKLGQLPLWDKIQPQHIQPAVETLIVEETASLEFVEQDLLSGTGQLNFDRVFKPLTQIQMRTDFVSGQFSHLSVRIKPLVSSGCVRLSFCGLLMAVTRLAL